MQGRNWEAIWKVSWRVRGLRELECAFNGRALLRNRYERCGLSARLRLVFPATTTLQSSRERVNGAWAARQDGSHRTGVDSPISLHLSIESFTHRSCFAA